MHGTEAPLNALLILARATHFAAVMLLFGELVFVLFVARAPRRDAGRVSPDEDFGVDRHLLVVASWSVVVSIASGAAWLAAEAADMSGLPLWEATGRNTLGLVLGTTVFGRVWILRFVLVIGIGLLLLAAARSTERQRSLRIQSGALVLAGAYLASLAWAGHAAAARGPERFVQIISDVVHLLAAGAWLGALPGLVFLLGGTHALRKAAQATRRFSIVGMVSVGALIATGFINAWFLVGSVPALIGTGYGRLLLAKLALVVLMVSLAAVNRLHLSPRLQGHAPEARRLLRHNAILETAGGIGVVAIVGSLGVTIPGAHQSPLWPFDYTLSWEPEQRSAVVRSALTAIGVLACIAAAVVVKGVHTRRRGMLIAALVGVGVSAAASAWVLAVPAYPTTYVSSPVRYTTTAISRGIVLYTENCASCHGRYGYGDGPAASSLSIKPANLVRHAAHHPAGNLFWWIKHGIPGTPMSAFASRMSDADVWNEVQFMRARSNAEEARTLTGNVGPWRPIEAPDFTFERAPHTQESLTRQRTRSATLLVFYTLPQSLARLEVLAGSSDALTSAGLRVIALPAAGSAPRDVPQMPGTESMLAIGGSDVRKAYAMFARGPGADFVEALPEHVEFLLDGDGYLRARWIGVQAAAANRPTDLVHVVEVVNRETPHPRALAAHMH
jgi:putative copper export protein/mono/diheme cytochrome c family protein